jgi:hypothetical protein
MKFAIKQRVPLHSENVGVWCAVCLRRIICPIFFHETVNCGHYVNDILNPFFNQLTAEMLFRHHALFPVSSLVERTVFVEKAVLEDFTMPCVFFVRGGIGSFLDCYC